ncbi:pyocin knob domain-containing S74 family peptidase [Ensifer adhaerens]|uniref:pyocin knob domain-containing S74 family peptidase n=1 Tax=Ensifer adhaerens TaxID=106592 RepID=UPI0021019671|nr:pyocin knob domain-containing S74 family peptidase [Ensifer adhaerens]UTV37652.1 pyocin knob domain-containing S74 family peptidase [Ensifer adhaerens]
MTTPYTTGSVTLTNGSAVVTGVGTAWQTALIAGGTIYVEADGNPLPILTVDTNTKITAAIKWKGASGSYPYAIMRDTAYGQQTVANAQALSTYLQRLDNASLAALASLVPAADRMPFFSGNAEAALTTLTAFARTLLDDANGAAAYATLGEIPNGQVPDRLKTTSLLLVDANDANGTGMFYVNGATANIPEGAQGSLLQIQGSSSTKTQIYIRNSSGNFWSRTMNAAVWSAWTRSIVATTDGYVGTALRVQESGTIPPLSSATMLVVQKAGESLIQMVAGAGNQNHIYFGDPTAGLKGAIRYSNADLAMRIYCDGLLAISFMQNGTVRSIPTYNETTASAANMFVATNGTFARATSSGQYKTQVEDLWVDYVDTILQMRPVWYRSLCPMDNPEWSYIGLIAEEVGAIEPRLVHWRTEEIVTETVEKQVTVSVERPVEREVQVTRTEYVDTGLLDDEGEPLFKAVERTETIVEVDMVTVEEVQTITETEQRSLPLPAPVAEGIMYERLVVHLIAHAQRQHEKVETLTTQMAGLLARVEALEGVG